MTGPSIKELAERTDKVLIQLRGLARRMAVTVTTQAAAWALEGVRVSATNVERVTAELFSGIGFYARPAANGKPEAAMLNIGSAKHPVIVATRDLGALKAIAQTIGGGPAAGETIVFAAAGGAVLYLKADGSIEARAGAGEARVTVHANGSAELTGGTGARAVVLNDGSVQLQAGAGDARLVVNADGTIEARTAGGVAVELATKADVEAQVAWAKVHTHGGVTAGGAATLVPTVVPPNPDGTTVFKGQ
jgi:hypothetical protein